MRTDGSRFWNNRRWIYFSQESLRSSEALYKAYVDVTGDTANKPMVIGGGTYAKVPEKYHRLRT